MRRASAATPRRPSCCPPLRSSPQYGAGTRADDSPAPCTVGPAAHHPRRQWNERGARGVECAPRRFASRPPFRYLCRQEGDAERAYGSLAGRLAQAPRWLGPPVVAGFAPDRGCGSECFVRPPGGRKFAHTRRSTVNRPVAPLIVGRFGSGSHRPAPVRGILYAAAPARRSACARRRENLHGAVV